MIEWVKTKIGRIIMERWSLTKKKDNTGSSYKAAGENQDCAGDINWMVRKWLKLCYQKEYPFIFAFQNILEGGENNM